MRSDTEVKRDVLEELAWQPSVDHTRISVTVTNGVVTLGGTVPSFAQLHTAVTAAERIKGVRAVAQELEVELPDGHQRTDEALAAAVANALEWDTLVPKGNVTVEVQ